jgi:hypothetical protein
MNNNMQKISKTRLGHPVFELKLKVSDIQNSFPIEKHPHLINIIF